jgi:hypothetical protein
MVVIFAMCKFCTERYSGVNSIFVPCSEGLEFKSRPRAGCRTQGFSYISSNPLGK